MAAFKDLSGQVRGELTILECAGRNKHSKALFLCRCSCGELTTVLGNSILTGRTISCGCVHKATTANIRTTHGHTRSQATPEQRATYASWKSMLARCRNPKEVGYVHYGGRGISVCAAWKSSYHNFVKDMGVKPSVELSIERRNYNGNYEPANCYWANDSVQVTNRRCNADAIAARQQTATIMELYQAGTSQRVLAKQFNVSHSTVRRIPGVMGR